MLYSIILYVVFYHILCCIILFYLQYCSKIIGKLPYYIALNLSIIIYILTISLPLTPFNLIGHYCISWEISIAHINWCGCFELESGDGNETWCCSCRSEIRYKCCCRRGTYVTYLSFFNINLESPEHLYCVRLSVSMPVYMSVCVFVCLSVCCPVVCLSV